MRLLLVLVVVGVMLVCVLLLRGEQLRTHMVVHVTHTGRAGSMLTSVFRTVAWTFVAFQDFSLTTTGGGGRAGSTSKRQRPKLHAEMLNRVYGRWQGDRWTLAMHRTVSAGKGQPWGCGCL